MNSGSQEFSDFSSWLTWSSRIADSAPKNPGVYAFRLTRSFGRIKGESDIVYIGCTEAAARTLSKRLRDHVQASDAVGSRLSTVAGRGNLEVAWRVADSSGDAKHAERLLLSTYIEEHIELPPLNRKFPGTTFWEAVRAVCVLAPEVPREKVIKAIRELEARKRTPNS